ncbi:MAG: ribokinase [Anaerolineae bacterium]|nr:ribokinase [Anaerolineae bacterium]
MTPSQLIPRLAGQRVIVLGDVILDEYLIGKAMRLSREAPVPVLEFEERRLIPGGAANPAANVVALGSMAIQIGVIGADREAGALRDVLHARGIESHTLVVDGGRPTTVKTRVMAQMGLRFPQQVARLDKLAREPITPLIERTLCGRLADQVVGATALLISDYHVGLLTPSMVEAACEIARDARLLITADAQGALDKYTGVSVVKCNADEAREYLRRDLETDDEFAAAARDLCSELQLGTGMVITRGAGGATVATVDGITTHCPAPVTTDVYDTVGAGDTAIAVITLAVASGASLVDAAILANYASGLVVRRVGNYAPTPDELMQAVEAWKL